MFELQVHSAPYGSCEAHIRRSVATSRPKDQVGLLIIEAELLLFRKHNLNINAMVFSVTSTVIHLVAKFLIFKKHGST
jgi:hypothetical protein